MNQVLEFDLGNDFEKSDIKLNEIELPQSQKSVNFGTGIEYLMNDKKKSNSFNVDLGELDQLEQELNELSGADVEVNNQGFTKNFFNFGSKDESINLNNDSKLGSATANSVNGISSSSDGFSKMNDIPIENTSKYSERERRRKKRMMIKSMETWYDRGLIKNSSNFNLDSTYEEVEDEYEACLGDKRKKDGIKVYGQWFMTLIHSVEYANSYLDPFDINLDGWGEAVNEDLDSYEEIFSELQEKYRGIKLAPEIKLLGKFGFSAVCVHFANKSLSTATPGYQDIVKQSPELMKAYASATVDMMSKQSSGFNFASNMLNKDEENTSFGPPPAPLETKLEPPSQRRVPMNQMQFSQRPDIEASRGNTMFREQGVDINNNQENLNFQRSQITRPEQQQRPEMKGPQNMDIDNLLSGLKTRDIRQPKIDENDSIMSSTSTNVSKPKRNYKRKISERNTISLDI
jgi:hypothetical protein